MKDPKAAAAGRSGLMNLYDGWQPGAEVAHEPIYEDMRLMAYTYLTTTSAAEAILPRPLEVVSDPRVALVVADFPRWYNWEGTCYGYNELMVLVECAYRGERGVNVAFEYIGSRTGDFTEAADVALCMGREGMGIPKKLANIHINMDAEDEWCAVVARRGVDLVRYRAKFGEAIAPSQATTAGMGPRYFVVKEIMSGDFQSWDVRKIYAGSTSWLTSPKRIRSGEGTIEIGSLPGDRLDVLEPVAPGVFLELVGDLNGVEPELVEDLEA